MLAAAACIGGVGLQFIRPKLESGPVTAELQTPPAVEGILRNSCYNCHSYETRLVWFDYIVPGYWLVVSDVKEGRRHVNFSELGSKPVAEQRAVLFEAVSQIELGAMPLKSYVLAHPEAKVTAEELGELKSYLETLEVHKTLDEEETAGADAEYVKWAGAGGAAAKVQAAPNGIEFPADYKNWRVISSTNRMDNGTLREVLGNDVAVKAVQEGEINPWPDGTMLAKVAWVQLADGDGSVRAGRFKQVEFMIKDRQKYAATKGWGWARWLGTDLKPYGTSAAFTDSCVSCHLPLRDNDFVFSLPLKGEP
jgi:hypothetical protein